jgi:hypothetical protein
LEKGLNNKYLAGRLPYNGRCCRFVRQPQHSYIGDFVSHPNAEEQLPGRLC